MNKAKGLAMIDKKLIRSLSRVKLEEMMAGAAKDSPKYILAAAELARRKKKAEKKAEKAAGLSDKGNKAA